MRVGAAFTGTKGVSGLSAIGVSERAPYIGGDRMWFEYVAVGNDGGTRRALASAQRGRVDIFGPKEDVAMGPPSAADDIEPVITNDRLVLYFGSSRLGGQGGIDIWATTRTDLTSAWEPPAPVKELGSSSDESPSWISPDDCEIYFHRVVGMEYRIFRARRPPP